MESKRSETFCGFFYKKTSNGSEKRLGCSKGSTTHQGAPGGPRVPWCVVPTSSAPWTASLLYKYPNIPETLGESTKINSSRRKFQNHQIQLDTIMEGFIILIGASPMMRE